MKSKSEYRVMPLWVRANRKDVNRWKANASLASMPLADYIRNCVDFAIEHRAGSFAAECGNNCNHNGSDKP